MLLIRPTAENLNLTSAAAAAAEGLLGVGFSERISQTKIPSRIYCVFRPDCFQLVDSLLSLLPMDAAPRSKVDAGVAPRPTLPWQRSSSVAAHAGETAVPLLRPRNHARAESLQYRFVCAMQHNFPVGLANQDGFRCLGPFLDKTGSTGSAGWTGSIARSGDVATSKVLPSHRTLPLEN
jgi:hypothetical protein